MKHSLFFKLALFLTLSLVSLSSFSQVGVNVVPPSVTLDVKYNPNSNALAGIRAPRITGDDLYALTYTAEHDGAIVYVTAPASDLNQKNQTEEIKSKGYYYFDIDAPQTTSSQVGKWIRWIAPSTLPAPVISVEAGTLSGAYISGVALNNTHKVTFKVTNNSLQAINSVDFSNDVTIENATANITVDGSANSNISLNPGETKTLTYQLSGSPAEGTLIAHFQKTLGDLQAELVTQVGLGSATLSDKTEYVVSFTYNGTEIQGKINNADEQVSIKIPYTGGLGSYNAFTQTQTSATGEGGDVNALTLNIAEGTFANEGYLTANIEVGGDGEYLVTKLAPGAEYVIATYSLNLNGATCQVILKGIGGIPDRHFGEADQKHDFIYLPVEVTADNGYNETWLNLNLGAEYANIHSANFDPTIEKTGTDAHQDANTYGSLFQWQRPAEGHELRTSANTSGYAPSWTDMGSKLGKFIANNHHNWVSNGSSASGDDLNLWKEGGANQVCPVGYHVPTKAEWQAFHQAVTGSQTEVNNNNIWLQTLLSNLSAAGHRLYGNGSLVHTGSTGLYWSSESYSSYGSPLYFNSSKSSTKQGTYVYRSRGFSVRCLKD